MSSPSPLFPRHRANVPEYPRSPLFRGHRPEFFHSVKKGEPRTQAAWRVRAQALHPLPLHAGKRTARQRCRFFSPHRQQSFPALSRTRIRKRQETCQIVSSNCIPLPLTWHAPWISLSFKSSCLKHNLCIKSCCLSRLRKSNFKGARVFLPAKIELKWRTGKSTLR